MQLYILILFDKRGLIESFLLIINGVVAILRQSRSPLIYTGVVAGKVLSRGVLEVVDDSLLLAEAGFAGSGVSGGVGAFSDGWILYDEWTTFIGGVFRGKILLGGGVRLDNLLRLEGGSIIFYPFFLLRAKRRKTHFF